MGHVNLLNIQTAHKSQQLSKIRSENDKDNTIMATVT